MRERAYRQLRHLLILQQIPAGKRLREAEWTARLKVNRSALREAFARLEAQGLIETGPKTGYLVPSLDKKNIREILLVRVMLETGAIEIICSSGLNTPEHLKPMIDACDEMESLVRDGDIVRVAEADWRFHHALIDASRNKRLCSVYQHAPLPLLIPEETSGPAWEERVRQTVREHRAILDSLLKGDTNRAIDLLRGHISERALAYHEIQTPLLGDKADGNDPH
jgi:DNA-binding GntR family transcriptional regulator